jgi:hypothetical protein
MLNFDAEHCLEDKLCLPLMIRGNKRSTDLPLEQRIPLLQSVGSRKSMRLAFIR